MNKNILLVLTLVSSSLPGMQPNQEMAATSSSALNIPSAQMAARALQGPSKKATYALAIDAGEGDSSLLKGRHPFIEIVLDLPLCTLDLADRCKQLNLSLYYILMAEDKEATLRADNRIKSILKHLKDPDEDMINFIFNRDRFLRPCVLESMFELEKEL